MKAPEGHPTSEDRSESRSWRLASDRRIPVLSATYYEQNFARHAHDHFLIGLVEKGACRSWYRGSIWHVPEGTLCLMPPGEVHDGAPVPGSPWVWRTLYPSLQFVTRISQELFGERRAAPETPILLRGGGLPDIPVTVRYDRELSSRFLAIHQAFEEGTDDFTAESSLVALFGDLLSRHGHAVLRLPKRGRDTRAVARAREIIHQHFQEPLRITDVAEAVGLSVYYLIRTFSRELGLPPHAYLTQVRVEAAKKMMMQGLDIATAAGASGFVDQSHLTRWFRRYVGVTPGEFLRGT